CITDRFEPTFHLKETELIESNATGAPANAVKPNPADAMPYDPRADLSRYVFPGLDLLEDRPSGSLIDPEEQQKNKDLIVKTLLDYKIPIQRIEATIGPTVTLYEIVPAEGVRIAQIQRLENDIALSLAALGIRIIAPIPGAGTVGIEVPNRDPKTVSIRSIIGSQKFAEACQKMRLPMAMGATISNDIFIQDLAKMPHLLVAGATGQGKSVGLNCIIASLLYAKHPSELKFVFIDPKMVEFAAYRKIERHFLAKLPDEEEPIITDPMKVPGTLSSLCVEMDNRYLLMSKANVRSVEEYNRKFCNHGLNPENGHKYMPYLVTIVDEFADLIMVGGKEVPMHIARIAQKGRAAGMHII
ncbi:MAG: DNA translocase FtsK, partial [Muribaculaceae bacterium]|nr:DNA translocase FtsK [Muribaculaceae bacterium]